ncbi:P-loop containing nucleoside triphosphate hydrolase protein [Dichomitus squalens LYAD-421 SS1]|uniref:P-loop containing nucleoside triphosphate hydrolase protein n=1 Tax=Dichomitus squalens (strain LYAD-421) TaxID=732165 RepID=R7SM65_DICSQ|nr:P-loop containing nucleoside triphosphate hydrolase protein [Dichomitus squalens LYAD-421 SS1]EJF57211.1 P-loop containing nucleoside triphosphate hydrolase protein [Dichomitus squalens LYAD-421 SS1]
MTLPQMIMMIFSMSAFRDWAKLLLIGAFLETCRRSFTRVWEGIVDYFWVTVSLDWDDDAADWLMYWLSRRKVFQTARSIEVSTYFFGLDDARADDLGEVEDGEDQVSFLPSLSRTYSFWYRRRYVTVSRNRENEGGWHRPKVRLEVQMLTRNSRLLRELLMEARKEYKAASEHLINVYVAETSDRWKRVATQEKRPTSSVILDPGVLELILDDAKDFLSSRKWYADRGIPFRRGYLLYGAPGAGKTSLIHSIAGELGLDIYILSLTVMALDDNSLKSLIAHLPKSCIVLIEDIDAAFTRGMKRDISDPEAQGGPASAAEGSPREDGSKGNKSTRDTLFNGVTLSGLLNALDGIAAQEGRILFATTNDYSALDPALLRPGRLDLHIEFNLASEYQAKELFKRFYTSSADAPAEEADEKINEKDSGYNSRSASPARAAAADPQSSAMPESVKSVYVGMTHATRTYQLSPEKAEALAERFAAIIPPRTFSMATLQGYLMAYKVRPYAAVMEAPAWVEKKQKEKAGQAVAKKDSSLSGEGLDNASKVSS